MAADTALGVLLGLLAGLMLVAGAVGMIVLGVRQMARAARSQGGGGRDSQEELDGN
jgi:hypothetical protein